MTIAIEAEIREPDATRDSEQPTLLSQGEVIESACKLFAPEESEDNKANDILQIIGLCLKDANVMFLGTWPYFSFIFHLFLSPFDCYILIGSHDPAFLPGTPLFPCFGRPYCSPL